MASEKGDFSKNYVILQLVKKGPLEVLHYSSKLSFPEDVGPERSGFLQNHLQSSRLLIMAKKKKQPKNKRDRLWIEAKRRCRLNDNDIQIAKELGLNPRSLIKNIPSKTEQWKLPVKDWIHQIYQKRQEKSERKKARKGQATAN